MFLTKSTEHILSPLPGTEDWVVRSPIRYHSKVLNAPICVLENFITDLASVPRPLWWWYPPCGKYDLAVILHDWMFWMQIGTFQQANAVLREAMLDCGCSKADADRFHLAVSLGSKSIWNKYSKMNAEERITGFALHKDGELISLK